jgi:hypothetical protein
MRELHAYSGDCLTADHARFLCCSLPLQAQAARVEEEVRRAVAGVCRVLQRAILFDGLGMQASTERAECLPQKKVQPMRCVLDIAFASVMTPLACKSAIIWQ